MKRYKKGQTLYMRFDAVDSAADCVQVMAVSTGRTRYDIPVALNDNGEWVAEWNTTDAELGNYTLVVYAGDKMIHINHAISMVTDGEGGADEAGITTSKTPFASTPKEPETKKVAAGIASAAQLGTIKVGDGLLISPNGTLSVDIAWVRRQLAQEYKPDVILD